MKTSDLLTLLDQMDQKGAWLFTSQMLKLLLNESDRACLATINRASKSGILRQVHKGIYSNDRAKSKPPHAAETLSLYLKPGTLSYLSLESRLSELGIISQIPSRLTFMTTGRSQTFHTAYGTLEFVHTKRSPEKIMPDISMDQQRGIYVASPERALKDLRHVRRNLDLISQESADEIHH